MDERDETKRKTAPGAHPTGDAYETDYRDPRATTPTTTKRGRSSSWIGVVVAVLAILVIVAWWSGAFYGDNEVPVVAGEPVVEGEVVQ